MRASKSLNVIYFAQPLLSDRAEDSTFIDCAPSYFYQKGTTGDAVATLDTPIFTKILSSGSVVVSSGARTLH